MIHVDQEKLGLKSYEIYNMSHNTLNELLTITLVLLRITLLCKNVFLLNMNFILVCFKLNLFGHNNYHCKYLTTTDNICRVVFM